MIFYMVYGSKYNKETLGTLKDVFTFQEFNYHREYILIQEDLEAESYETSNGK